MIDPISAASQVSGKEARTAMLSSPHVDNSTVNSKKSNDEIRQVKKTEATLEKIEKTSKESLERTIQALKDYIESNKRSLKIQVHQETGEIIIKVISEKDGTVIREITSKRLLNLVDNMEDFSGSLFNSKA